MNILFITADQWRGECLSVLGHPHVRTPNLEALAAGGVTFRRHFAQATPCGPSRACLYTGMYMQNHRSVLNGTPLDARHTNMALEARKGGYEPVLFGFTDIGPDPRQYAPGDDILKSYEGVLPGMEALTHLVSDRKPWLEHLKAKGYEVPENPKEIFKPKSKYPGAENKGKTFAPAFFKAQDSGAAFLVDEAVNYLSGPRTTPWFVHMSFLAPHPPFVVPEPYHDQYDARDMPLPVRRETAEKEAAQHPWLKHYIFNQRGESYTYGANSSDNIFLSEQDLRQIRATYYAMMSEVDAQIGRLIESLKQLGCYDDTLIIFASDHGEQLGDHWMFAKFGYFDQTFHIPLIIRDPSPDARCADGSLVDAFTESIDIMPTILEAIGLDIPTQCDGHSLIPFCRGEQPGGWRREYHAEFDLRSPYEIDEIPPMGLAMEKCSANIIRGERYKYVHFSGLAPLFFDLEDDPDEFIDRSTDPDYQGRMLEYARKMLSWRMEHDDPALTDLHLTQDGVVCEMRSK